MKRSKLSIAFLLFTIGIAVACFRPDPAIVARLQRAAHALGTIDFAAEESVHLRVGDEDVTWQSEMFHRRDQGTRRRRLNDDDPRSSERFPKRFDPGETSARFTDFLTGAPQHLELLCSNYRMALEGEESVANRPCDKLALRGRCQGRPTVKVWLDKDTGLPLKRCDVSPRGETTATREITKLRLGECGPDELFARFPARDERSVTLDEARTLLPGFVRPTSLPHGFELGDISVANHHGRSKIRMTYTDGLAKLVIYQSTANDDDEPPGRSERELVARRRSFKDFTVLSSRLGDVRVVICSSLSEDDLHGVLQGLRN